VVWYALHCWCVHYDLHCKAAIWHWPTGQGDPDELAAAVGLLDFAFHSPLPHKHHATLTTMMKIPAMLDSPESSDEEKVIHNLFK
jgi:hypothetical protein